MLTKDETITSVYIHLSLDKTDKGIYTYVLRVLRGSSSLDFSPLKGSTVVSIHL